MTVRKYEETVREVKQMIDFTREIWYTEGKHKPRIAAASRGGGTPARDLNHSTEKECMI